MKSNRQNNKKRVLFVDSTHPCLQEMLVEFGFQCDYFENYSKEDCLKIIESYHGIIIRSKFFIDAVFIDKAKNLEFIARVGAGMESIDVSYATKKGIKCINSPEGNRDAVGEHTLGLLLNLCNNISRANNQIKLHQWLRESNRGFELKHKTIGIIGYGNMGSAFAQRLKGFEVEILAYDKYKKNFGTELVKEVSMKEIFENVDVLSLHVPLTDETLFMCDKAYFEEFKKNIYFLNTARGKIVRTADLVNALKSKKIIGAGLDVIEYEDISFEHLKENFNHPDFVYLQQAENVILTPHIAGWTHDSKIKLATVLVDKIKALYQS